MFTKDQIQENIKTNVSWTIRTLEVLYSRQTTDEQVNQTTSHQNSRGFNSIDSFILTSFAQQVQKRRQYNNPVLLSDKQLTICQKKLPKYWKQIQEEIQLKQGNQ
jgi:predicted transcriptional regulator